MVNCVWHRMFLNTKVSLISVYGVPPTKSIEAPTLLHTPSTGQVHSTAGGPQPCIAIKMNIKLDWASVTKIVTWCNAWKPAGLLDPLSETSLLLVDNNQSMKAIQSILTCHWRWPTYCGYARERQGGWELQMLKTEQRERKQLDWLPPTGLPCP